MKTTDDSIGAQNDAALGPTEKITQYEVGLKFAGRRAGVFLTAFEMQQDNLLQQDFVFGPDGTPIRQTAQLDVRTPGIELEGMWTPLSGLTVDVRGVWQDPEMSTPLQAQNPADPTDYIPLEGKRPYRLPTLYGSVGAAYSLPSMNWGTITVNASYQYTGGRYVDLANQIKLSSFDEVFAGVSVALKNGFTFRVQAANLFNSKGITEGDPRSDQIVASTASYFNARPLLPRSIIASATYSF
jgi:outer membrane receptor protein involved in Fe transport